MIEVDDADEDGGKPKKRMPKAMAKRRASFKRHNARARAAAESQRLHASPAVKKAPWFTAK